MTADFGGYVTRSNIVCSDGRTILPDAFKDNDGMEVPLVFGHGHSDNQNVLGRVRLENRPDGVYGHAYFNATARGQDAKEQVKHGDLKFLSIFANQLTERAKQVFKGNIREVSLVLAGANPGAYIDSVNLAHGEDDYELYEDEGIIHSGMEIELNLDDEELSHADSKDASSKDDKDEKDNKMADEDRTIQDVVESMNDEQKNALYFLVGQAIQHSVDDEDDSFSHADDDDQQADDNDEDADESDDAADGAAEDESDENDADDNVEHNDTQEDNMTHNIFENQGSGSLAHTATPLTGDQLNAIIHSAAESGHGSLRTAVKQYVAENGVMVGGSLQHGIENIQYLFPDAKSVDASPQFLAQNMEWVDGVLNGVRKLPFARIKSIIADITAEEARARGYIKGEEKIEEFFTLAKRETTPQTIYKKQAIDRDDVLDITEIDVIAWMKAELQVMHKAEVAAAILFGDGRSMADPSKIKEDKVRPIASDDELFAVTVNVNLDDANSNVDELVDAIVAQRHLYKGSGNPTFFTTDEMVGKLLTAKDNFGRRLYSDLSAAASAMRVREIVPVEAMDRVSDLVGIMVNLNDYSIGTDRGGQATMFDDFDIDFNKNKYLLEARMSGALTRPKSALVFRKTAAEDVLATPTAPQRAGNVVTVPTVTGVTYKDGSGTTLTTASPVTITEGTTLKVTAEPNSGYYFATNANDQWSYTYKA